MSIKLDGRAYAVLGRSGDADVRLEGKLCSRKHAVIGFDTSREHVYLVDLNSAHGTWVDTVRIEAETKWRLKVGQEIWFGSAEGEPRYVVNAVCSRKREREENDGGKTSVRQKTDSHASGSAPQAPSHSKHGNDTQMVAASKRPFWNEETANGKDASKEKKDSKSSKHSKSRGDTDTSSGPCVPSNANFSHVLLRHAHSSPANSQLSKPDAVSKLEGYLCDVRRHEINFEQLVLRVSECEETKNIKGVLVSVYVVLTHA